MRILVLAQEKHSYTTRRLVEAAKALRVPIRVSAPQQLQLSFGAQAGFGAGTIAADVVVARFGASVQTYGVATLRHFELVGRATLNSASAMALVRDRVRCLQTLIAHDVPVPRGMLIRRSGDVKAALAAVGDLPVMLRRASGRPTFGALFCETEQGCLAALEALWGMGHEVIVTEHFGETQGEGLRCLIIDGEIVAAVRRQGRIVRTRFRFEPRGKAYEILPPRTLCELAAKTASATGLSVAAVDVLETAKGYRVTDVNAAPGIEQLELATGRDLAKLIVAAAIRKAKGSATRIADADRAGAKTRRRVKKNKRRRAALST